MTAASHPPDEPRVKGPKNVEADPRDERVMVGVDRWAHWRDVLPDDVLADIDEEAEQRRREDNRREDSDDEPLDLERLLPDIEPQPEPAPESQKKPRGDAP